MKKILFLILGIIIGIGIFYIITIITNRPSNKQEVVYTNEDKEVIVELENTLDEIKPQQVNKEFTDSAKKTFIDLVDFVFYGGSIKGHTFNELSDSGKQKVLELVNNIDNAIDSKIPNYKDSISNTASKAFNRASKLIKEGSNNLNTFLANKLSEEDYNAIINAKGDLVYYSQNAISFIKDNSSKIYNTAKEKLNDWYQQYKNN